MENSIRDKLTPMQIVRNVFRKTFVGDSAVWVLLVLMISCSIIAINSSTMSHTYTKNRDFYYYLIKQIELIGLGAIVLIITRSIPIKLYKIFAKVIFYATIVAMIYTLYNGKEINGAIRWIKIIGIEFQTSDMMRIGLFIMLTKVLWKFRNNIHTMEFIPFKVLFKPKQNKDEIIRILKNNTLPLFGPIALTCGLIMSQNLSTSLVVGCMSIIVIVIGGIKKSEIIKMIALAIITVSVMIVFYKVTGSGRYDTWTSRISQVFTGGDPLIDENGKEVNINELSQDDYQRVQSDIAIANGWKFGRGMGNSIQHNNLPHSYSDFMFSFILEECGLLGGVFVIFLYLWLFRRCIKISSKCEDSFSALLCLSMGVLFTGSAFSHIAVCVGIFPTTGLTLPFISHGGSSTIFSFVIIGIILRISYEQKMEEKRRAKELLEQQEMEYNYEYEYEKIQYKDGY